jgi:anti-sigma regulatory factor (Ser/Thr protein kinase)
MRKPLGVALLFWTGFALITAANLYVAMITHGHSFTRLVLFSVSVWWPWAFAAPAIAWLAERFPIAPVSTRNVLVHVLAAIAAGVGHCAAWIGLTVAIQPFDAMTIQEFGDPFIYSVAARLPSELLIYTATLVAILAADYRRRLREREQSLSAARLHALELQLQPHFLFNTLHSIAALVRGRRDADAIEMITGLSDLLRYTLDRAGRQQVPLEEEAAILRRYLDIQRIRFADRLAVTIEIAADARTAAVPALILQPLAENAIRHGIAKSAAAGRIDVRAFRRDGQLTIEMFNSGSLAAGANGDGIGLRNTTERLEQLYGADQRFELRELGGGVLASLTIPWSEA